MVGFSLTTEWTQLGRRLTQLAAKGRDLSKPLKAMADWLRVDAKKRLMGRESDDVHVSSGGGLWKSLRTAGFATYGEVSSDSPYARIQQEGGTVHPKGKALAQPVRRKERDAGTWPRAFRGELHFVKADAGKFPIIGYLIGHETGTASYFRQRYRQAQARSSGKKAREVRNVLLYILRKFTRIPSAPGNRWSPYIVMGREAQAYLRRRMALWFGLSDRWSDAA